MVNNLDKLADQLDLKISDCDTNTKKWIKRFPDFDRVPGWICYMGNHFAFHWVVKSPEGKLLDVTPIEHCRDVNSTEVFVEHTGDVSEFEQAKVHVRSQFGLILTGSSG